MGTFHFRKRMQILPFLRMNASGSKRRGRGGRKGVSFTLHLGKWLSWNTSTRRTTVNPPGPGSWTSDPPKRRRGGGKRSSAARPKGPTKTQLAQDAAVWRDHFAGLTAAAGGGDQGRRHAAESARAAGRCLECGHVKRPGQWCTHCAQEAAKRHAAADAAEARASRTRRPTAVPPRPPSPQLTPTRREGFIVAPTPNDPTGPVYVWANEAGSGGVCLGGPFHDTKAAQEWITQNGRYLRAYTDGEARQSDDGGLAGLTRGASQEEWVSRALKSGRCGAPTQDGTACMNGAGCSIPSHRSKQRAGAAR